jgi:hypothetical protein
MRLGGFPMQADVQFLAPSCAECSRPMRLVSVLCSRTDVQPPVQTFECADCETDAIWQPPIDRVRTAQARR